MQKSVAMSQEEYRKYQEFSGAEKTLASLRAQMSLQCRAFEELASAVLGGFGQGDDGTIEILNEKQAALALTLAAEVLS